nr:unnamed protein product [Callosobruchus analis]
MGSLLKQSLSRNIHRIREFELEKVNLVEEFDILQIVGEGWFGKILLVEHKATDTEMVLKALPKPYTALKDFYREFHYGLHLGVHKNIITAYDIGIGELHTKRVAKQLASALDHIHSRELVHRDIKLDNILVFKSDFSRIKLCDFGEMRRAGSLVQRRNEWLPYAAPEVLQVPTDGDYVANTSHDIWQFGIVLFVCLTGCLPWQKAALDDPRFVRYLSWQTSNIPLKRQPKLFKLISSKAQRLFKKYLEPKQEKRPTTLAELHRYLDDRWMSKGMEKTNDTLKDDEGLCPSIYSFHSSPEEKNKLLFSLTQYGLETTVDRVAKKDRIREWIQNSVIEEEDEDVQDKSEDEENIKIHDIHTGPAGEMLENRGPIAEHKIKQTRHPRKNGTEHRERRLSIIRSNNYNKPLVDPRIPLELQKPITMPDTSVSNEPIVTAVNDARTKADEKQIPVPNTVNDPPVRMPNSASSDSATNSSESSFPVKQPSIGYRINTQHPQFRLIEANGGLVETRRRYK